MGGEEFTQGCRVQIKVEKEHSETGCLYVSLRRGGKGTGGEPQHGRRACVMVGGTR